MRLFDGSGGRAIAELDMPTDSASTVKPPTILCRIELPPVARGTHGRSRRWDRTGRLVALNRTLHQGIGPAGAMGRRALGASSPFACYRRCGLPPRECSLAPEAAALAGVNPRVLDVPPSGSVAGHKCPLARQQRCVKHRAALEASDVTIRLNPRGT